MDEVNDDALALRLEGAWPMLDSARLQYRAVVVALRAWGWRGRLRRVVDVAREVARRDEEIARHLERALHRADAERWPAGTVRSTLEELAAHRATLVGLLAGSPPSTALRELLREVLLAPRVVPAPERMTTACLALQLAPTLLETLESFGSALERVFSRPLPGLPFSRAEFDALLAAWPEGERAAKQAWHELERVDTSGALARSLRVRAAHAPGGMGLDPLDALLRAEFWKVTAEARLRALLESQFAPAHVQPAESTAAIRYLLGRREGSPARLEGARGALLMLAHELTCSDEAPLPGGRATLRSWAAEADRLRDDPDWQRLRASLGASSLQRLREGLLAPPRPPERLADLFFASAEP